ncbi:hypothetical protein VNO80_10583 [Phaseolus coccineus]|uniref:Uncharacterized protein n=1 Tax=Phaseolus coccineus TaxID=3886 RepID=A0AAN9RDJ6_PHACN
MFLVMWKPNGGILLGFIVSSDPVNDASEAISPLCLMNCLNGLYESGLMNLTRLLVLFSYAITAMSILGGVT